MRQRLIRFAVTTRRETGSEMTCFIVPYVTTRKPCNPQPVSNAGHSTVGWRRMWRCSSSFPRSFQRVNGIILCHSLPRMKDKQSCRVCLVSDFKECRGGKRFDRVLMFHARGRLRECNVRGGV